MSLSNEKKKMLIQAGLVPLSANKIKKKYALGCRLSRDVAARVLAGEVDAAIPCEEPRYSLKLKVNLCYTPKLAPGEKLHVILVYITCSDTVHRIEASKALTPRASFTLTFSTFRPALCKSDRISFDTYAIVSNDFGQHCMNQSGYASAFIHELTPFKKSLSLRIPTSHLYLPKGTITASVEANDISSRSVGYDHALLSSLTASYIKLNQAFYATKPPSVDDIATITNYIFVGRNGIAPGGIFNVARIPHSKEDFFLHALDTALKRRFLDAPPADTHTLTLLLMDMVTIFANYVRYITDYAQFGKFKDLTDSFDIVRLRLAGDCEDGAMEILLECLEIKYGTFESAIMNRLQQIAKGFIFCTALCAISGMAANDGEGCTGMGGHMCAMAVPNKLFFSHIPDHPAAQLWPFEETQRGGDLIYPLESTGNLWCNPKDVSARYSNIKRTLRPTLERHQYLVRQFFYSSTHEGFIKKVISLYTPEIYYRTGVPSIEFVVCSDGKRGVPMSQFTANRGISIEPCPFIPEKLMKLALRMQRDNLPVTPLEPPLDRSEELVTLTQASDSRLPPYDDTFIVLVPLHRMNDSLKRDLLSVATIHSLNVLVRKEIIAETPQGPFGGYCVYVW